MIDILPGLATPHCRQSLEVENIALHDDARPKTRCCHADTPTDYPARNRSGNAIIFSDIEVPDHDVWMLRAALLTGMRYGIRKLIFAGDLIATDQQALNSWLTTWADEHGKSYKVCLNELKQIIRAMALWFTEGIYAITGNHDERLARRTGGEVTIQDLLENEPLDFSMYSYMHILSPTSGEYTYLCHQYIYSKTPVRLAQDIWAVETAPDGRDHETGTCRQGNLSIGCPVDT